LSCLSVVSPPVAHYLLSRVLDTMFGQSSPYRQGYSRGMDTLSAHHNSMLTFLDNGEAIPVKGTNLDEHREDLKRDMIEDGCHKLEGNSNFLIFSIFSFVLACILTMGAVLSPLEIFAFFEDPCPRLFFILAQTFVIVESYFLVKHKRDNSLLPRMDSHFEVSPEYYFLTHMDPAEWDSAFGPRECSPAQDPDTILVPGGAYGPPKATRLYIEGPKVPLMNKPMEKSIESRRELNVEPEEHWWRPCATYKRELIGAPPTPTGPLIMPLQIERTWEICPVVPSSPEARQKFCEHTMYSYFSIFAVISAIVFMFIGDPKHPHAVMFFGLTALYLLSSSLTLFLILRDRMAARIWRYYMMDSARHKNDRTGDKLATFIVANIMRSLKTVDIRGVFQLIRILSLGATLSALPWKEHFQKAMPGFYLVLISLLFTIVAGMFLAEFWFSKDDEVDAHAEGQFSGFAGLVPVMIMFGVAIGLTIWGVITMNWGLTEKLAVIMGVGVFVDSSFHCEKYNQRQNDAGKLQEKWHQRFGSEQHMVIPMQMFEKL